MRSSDKSFKEITNDFFAEVFLHIDAVCGELGITAYLIGAKARDILMAEKGIKPVRGTMDIDFAVMLPDMDVYEQMKGRLIDHGFRKVKEPYRMIYDKTDTVVDILPFGEIEEEGTVSFTEREIDLSVLGMREVMGSATPKLVGGVTVNVPPLEGIVILKLIAYQEKPSRTKDLDDFNVIVNHYFDINDARFYADHLDVLDELDDKNFKVEAGARLIGRDVRKIIDKSDVLREIIIAIIQSELDKEPGIIGRYMLSRGYFTDHQQILKIFHLIDMGLNE